MRPLRRSDRRWLWAAGSLLLLALLLDGCRQRLAAPDLGGIYGRDAIRHHLERNPVILIPGIMGTRLEDATTGEVAWGNFGGGALDPTRPDGARRFALPLRADERPPAPVVPAGVLDRVRVRLFGLPLEQQAYFYLLSMLGSAGFRDESLARSGAVDYGDDHFTCFQFGYDWRLDNADNARRLDDFIHRKKAYVEAQLRRRGIEREVRFDVVAHSMGALLTRYYLRYGRQPLPADGSLPQLTWAGARLVERAILVGPPNGGSLVVLERIVRGHKPGAFLPRYPPAVIGSFPSVYQLLPRSRHGAYVDAGHRRQLDLFDPALWQRLGWGLADPRQDEVLAWLLPDVGARNERRRLARAALARHLDRARRFHAALDRPATPPAGTTLVLVAGDAVPTAASIAIDLDGGDFEVASRAPGDGIVLRSSALMDERRISDWRATLRSPIAWHAVTFFFDDHLGLVRDPTFTDNVLYQLLEEPRRPFDDARREGQSDRLPGTVSRK